VVLGTGWGAVAVMANIDPFKYEIVCISPRYVARTPLPQPRISSLPWQGQS
jgi:NADH dehydrogenase FAD-containing subunit